MKYSAGRTGILLASENDYSKPTSAVFLPTLVTKSSQPEIKEKYQHVPTMTRSQTETALSCAFPLGGRAGRAGLSQEVK